MENKFDSTISKLLNEMILSTSTQKPWINTLSSRGQSGLLNSTAPKHWLDDALEKIQSGQLTAKDLAELDGVKNLDPKAKALLIQALAHQSA